MAELKFNHADEVVKRGYDAYGEDAGWKNYAGLPMPPWEELPVKIRQHWVKAAMAIVKAVFEDDGTG